MNSRESLSRNLANRNVIEPVMRLPVHIDGMDKCLKKKKNGYTVEVNFNNENKEINTHGINQNVVTSDILDTNSFHVKNDDKIKQTHNDSVEEVDAYEFGECPKIVPENFTYVVPTPIEDKVLVGVRVRPIIGEESKFTSQVLWALDIPGNRIYSLPIDWERLTPEEMQRLPDHRRTDAKFSKVFGSNSSNNEIYQCQVLNVVQRVVEGYNGTVMAYGQTTSGKTHTISGGNQEEGILQLALRDLFRFIDQKGFGSKFRFVVRISYCEIYQETVNDLLDPKNRNLNIVDDEIWGPSIKNLTFVLVKSQQEALKWLNQGQANRHVGQTKMTKYSSRSHTIFDIRVESKPRLEHIENLHSVEKKKNISMNQKETQQGINFSDILGESNIYDRENAIASNALRCWVNDDQKPLTVSTLKVIDLAGSERVSKTGAKGSQLKEAGSINKSLSALGNVINAINDGTSHIPFRNSKLTRLLSASLGDNSNTSLICCMSPALTHHDESRSTLQFAERASNVRTTARLNQLETGDAILQAFKTQISGLQYELALEVNEKHNLETRVNDLQKKLSQTLSNTLCTPLFVRRHVERSVLNGETGLYCYDDAENLTAGVRLDKDITRSNKAVSTAESKNIERENQLKNTVVSLEENSHVVQT